MKRENVSDDRTEFYGNYSFKICFHNGYEKVGAAEKVALLRHLGIRLEKVEVRSMKYEI